MTAGGAAGRAHARNGWAWIALLGVTASIARTVADGQDFNFDLVTYHFYLGYSAFSDRTSLDFLPASFQGYQSPLPYVLLYWLDSVGAPPVVNAAIHASLHALNLVALYFLAELLIAGTAQARSRIALLSLWLMGAIAPVYWLVVGTSFADLLTSVLVLAGLWLIALSLQPRADRAGIAWCLLIAGAACAGAAVGMRLHNAIYVVALFGALVAADLPGRSGRTHVLGAFALAAAAGGLASFVPWGWRIFREFGNPVFPFFNAVFRSPDFPAANLPLTSFVPRSVAELAALPFRIGTNADWVYVETHLPDLRPGLLAACAAAFLLVRAYRRFRPAQAGEPEPSPARRLILAFFLCGAVLWLATSCNGRYGVALFLLAGPVCAALLYRMLPMRYVLLVVGATLAWQAAVQQVFFGIPRWVSAPWGARYFDWDVPSSMLREPAVYLSFGAQTASSLVPRIHPGSRHANLVGQYSLGFEQPGAERIRRMIGSHGQRIYGLFDFYYTQQSDPASRSIKSYFGEQLRLWGLDFSESPCRQLALKPASGWDGINRLAGIGYRGRLPELLLCELRASAPADHDRAIHELRSFQSRLAPLGAACPRIFSKPLSMTRQGGSWIVTSFASFESQLEFYDGGQFFLQQLRPPYAGLALGAVAPDAIIAEEPDCAKWFARLDEVAAEAPRR